MHAGLLRSSVPYALLVAFVGGGAYVTLGPVTGGLDGTESSAGALGEGSTAPGSLPGAGAPPGTGVGAVGSAAAAPRLEGRRGAGGARATRDRTFPPCTLVRLSKMRGWTPFLRGWHGLPAATTREARAERLGALLAGVQDPVVRQNVIFAVALMVPWDEARPWLDGLRLGPDADDAEDALVALAFSGDPAVRAAFLALASTASPAHVKRLVDGFEEHDKIAAEGTREARLALRAWRAVEALDREPYFKIVPYEVTHDWSGEGSRGLLGWLPGQPLLDAEREALLKAWLARYPGHPGTDGIALRVGSLRLRAGDASGAATWFARALAGCDQDQAGHAAGPLVALVEAELPLAELSYLASAEGVDTPSRSLYQYAHLRRTAAEVGFDTACREAEALSRSQPGSELGWAWLARRTAPVPRGLSSGLTPLPSSDPLLAIAAEAPSAPGLRHLRRGSWVLDPLSPDVWRMEERLVPADVGVHDWVGHGQERLEPAGDPVVFDRERLLAQMRAWEALAELERRADGAKGVPRADLLYKQAAIFYHDRNVLFPCYERHDTTFRFTIGCAAPRRSSGERDPAAVAAHVSTFGAQTYAWERAVALFEALAEEVPEYPAMDKVLFSQAMCWKRLVDYRPRGAWDRFVYGLDDPDARPPLQAARRCVEAFERLVREHPASPLAIDAARAAAWWRKERPEAFATLATTGR